MYLSPDNASAMNSHARDGSANVDHNAGACHTRNIGELIQETQSLTTVQVEAILNHQREHGLRFGESAVALGLVQGRDVLWALSQQFQYPYADDVRSPLHADLVVANQPFSAQAEVFRSLRSQITMRTKVERQERRAIAVVSPDHGDGKSYFVANLAVAFSQLGGRTLLVDADLRSPRQHELFGLNNITGLSDILSGRNNERVVRPVPSLPSLYVLPVGAPPPNPQELVEGAAFGQLMQELLGKFDYVLVDTPATCEGADTNVIAARCGSSVAIARRGRSRMNALKTLVSVINASNVRVVGALLNEF